MHVGCRLRRLYTIGRIATIPWGGAESDNRESRFINDATSVAGKYLFVRNCKRLKITLTKGKGQTIEGIERSIECEIMLE